MPVHSCLYATAKLFARWLMTKACPPPKILGESRGISSIMWCVLGGGDVLWGVLRRRGEDLGSLGVLTD